MEKTIVLTLENHFNAPFIQLFRGSFFLAKKSNLDDIVTKIGIPHDGSIHMITSYKLTSGTIIHTH